MTGKVVFCLLLFAAPLLLRLPVESASAAKHFRAATPSLWAAPPPAEAAGDTFSPFESGTFRALEDANLGSCRGPGEKIALDPTSGTPLPSGDTRRTASAKRRPLYILLSVYRI